MYTLELHLINKEEGLWIGLSVSTPYMYDLALALLTHSAY